MSVASSIPSGPAVWRDADLTRRAGAYAGAALLHAGVLAVLLSLPPAAYEPVRRAVSAVEVRLYTVAGGEDAESDAPLFEPPMAAAEPDPAATPGEAGGARAVQEPAAAAEPETTPEPSSETAPETAPEATPEAAPETGAVSELAADTPAPAEPEAERLGGDEPAVEAADAPASASPPAAASAPGEPGAPLATTQIDPPRRSAVPAARAPSFADILARAENRLDPADYQVAELLGGARGAARESFCLSSASGNRDAMDCPDEPNAASAELARYGLMGLGEEMPEFDIDMSRLEYKLRTLGADDNAVTRILTALGEARHEAVYGGQLRRSMTRDRGDRDVDNLGNPRFAVPMPDNPGGD